VGRIRQVMPLQLASGALVSGTVAFATAALSRQADAAQVAIVIGAALITLACVHMLAWRRVLGDGTAAGGPPPSRADAALADETAPAAIERAA
jgi:hypothetical protein